jgi:UDP-MurNAc hydroxylase
MQEKVSSASRGTSVKITFVNHASFLLETKAASIWCDPWTMGKVVNNCCALYSPSAQVPIERVDHIWISHEHPDHFNFPTLKTIPEADRKRITILYQRHSSPRVVDALKKMGFTKIKELPLYRWVTLKPGVEILCGSIGTMDSFIAVKAEGECILNLNDCICTDTQLKYIKRRVGRPSMLLTQFSFAQWIGNLADDTDAVQQKIRELKYRIFLFQPEVTVPFASFGYFCNQENSWMNRFMITPAHVLAMNLPGVNFMYPGDEWDSDHRKFRTTEAVAKYMKDIERLEIDPTPPSVDDETVRQGVVKLLGALKKRFSRLVMARLQEFAVYTHDTKKIFRVFPAEGRCEVEPATPESAEKARYVMCSQVAWYTFAHTWGWNVVEGSGTYLDRQFKEKGENELWRRCITELSTDILRFDSPSRFFRTLGFLWGKKFEILYHFYGKQISDEMVDKSEFGGPRVEMGSAAGA